MKSRWWQATADGRRPVAASNGRTAAAVARELCGRGAVLAEERGGQLAVVLDPACQDDIAAVRALVTAAVGLAEGGGAAPARAGDAGRLVLRLPGPDGWHDSAAAGVDDLLEQAAAWIALARPPAWSSRRFAIAGDMAAPAGGAPVPAPAGPPPAWLLELTGRAVAGAADMLDFANRHASALEALLAAPAGAGAGADAAGAAVAGAPRYLDHQRADGRPPELTHAWVRDWIHEVAVTRHVILAHPVAPVTDRSQCIAVFPTLRVINPTLNKLCEIEREPAVGAFVLIFSAQV